MKGFILRTVLCIGFFSFALYSYLEEQNKCTELKMRLPKIMKEIQALDQENARLKYQIVTFESPDHLLHLAQEAPFAHLKFPFFQDVLKTKTGLALQLPSEEELVIPLVARSSSLVAAK